MSVNTIQYNTVICITHSGRLLVESEVRAVAGQAKGGYTLRVVREVRCVLSRCLNVSSVLDSLIVAGNSFQMVGAEKLKVITQAVLVGLEPATSESLVRDFY